MAITLNLSQAGATAYSVRDYSGAVVSSGSVSGTAVTISTPAAGWDNGWYRVYLTGPNVDAVYGNSYGVFNFLVIPSDSNFPTLPPSVRGYFGGYVPDGSGNDAWDPSPGATNSGVWSFDSGVDMISRSCLGLGIGRLSLIGDHANHNFDADHLNYSDTSGANEHFMNVVGNPWWFTMTEGGTVDPVRTRYQWAAVPNAGDGYDAIFLPDANQSAFDNWISLWPKTADLVRNAPDLYADCSAGTTAGTRKINIYSPDSTTLVETFDNLNPADRVGTCATINATSNYVVAAPGNHNTSGDMAVRSCLNTGYVNLKTAVARLYPVGITHYEGPRNEPNLSLNSGGQVYANALRVFSYAVHDGNASAKAMGPCTVNITDLAGWENFLASGGADTIDAISTHTYNSIINSDANLGRNTMEAFQALLKTYGADTLPLWQTEAAHAITSVGGVGAGNVGGACYMPRRARIAPMWWILWEQYGIPIERNPYWYDLSHGFWGYSSFMWAANTGYSKSSNPQVGLLSTLAREVYGKTFHHRVDFGSVSANQILVGSVYGAAVAGSTMALLSMSYIPNTSVKLTITGTASALTMVDAWGNESSLSQTSGRVTVPISDIPSYVRLPSGVNAAVYSVTVNGDDWGTSPNPSVSAAKYQATIGTQNVPGMADGQFMTSYSGLTSPGLYVSDQSLPDSASIVFYSTDTVNVERVIVWCGPFYQSMPGLYDFDVETYDGTSWTTQATVTRSPYATFRHGADFTETGTELETYDKEQWIESVTLPSPVDCQGVRVYVRQTSYGGAPDSDAASLLSPHGDATLTPKLAVQEIAVISSTTFSGSGYATTVTGDSPVAFWEEADTSGTTAVSQVNSPAVNGTYSGTYTLNQSGLPSGGSSVKWGSAGKITVLDATALHVGDIFTFETWVYLANSGITSRTLPGVIGSGGPAWFINSSRQHVLYRNGGAGGTLCTSTSAIPLNTWCHLVVTKNGSDVHQYINSVDVTGTVSNVTFSSPFVSWEMFTNFDSSEKSAMTAIYNAALTPSQVLAHYKAGAFSSSPGNSTAPHLEGTLAVGDQVSCVPGLWDPAPNAYSYQWQSSATSGGTYADIVGATSPVYELTSSESTKYVRCQVVASSVGGSSSAVSSDVFGPVS